MNTRFTTSLIVAVVTGLLVTVVGNAMAQSYLDGSSKARGDYGQMSRSEMRPVYRYATPNQQRSYSYEPAPNAAQQTPKTGGSGNADSGKTSANSTPTIPQGNVAQKRTQTQRVYSYEPGTSNGSMRNRSGSTPLWALPKSDSRKFSGQ